MLFPDKHLTEEKKREILPIKIAFYFTTILGLVYFCYESYFHFIKPIIEIIH